MKFYSYEELKSYYYDNDCPSGHQLNKKEHKWFRDAVKNAVSFLDNLRGEKKFELYLKCILNDIYEPPRCPICFSHILTVRKTDFSTYCSRKCMGEGTVSKRLITMEETYGDHVMRLEEFKNKVRQTNKEKYGTEYYTQTDEYKENVRQTNNEKYGADWFVCSDEMKQIRKESCMEKHGVDNYAKTEEYKRKTEETCMARYGVKHYSQTEEYRQKIISTSLMKYGVDNFNKILFSDNTLEILEDKNKLKEMYDRFKNITKMAMHLGDISPSGLGIYLKKYGIEINRKFQTSIAEQKISEFLTSLGIEHERNVKILQNNKEVDIFIPSHNVAIEFNGVYWHSERFKDKRYHQLKSLECKEMGILLIHVWEDDWGNEAKRTIIENKIKSKLGLSTEKIYARLCDVCVIDQKEASKFLDKNHIQGRTIGSLWYGLKYRDELVSVVGFKRTKDSHVFDLVRYSTSKTVVGGFSKLLSYFKKNNQWKSVFTYASLDYSHGDLYEKTGFTLSHVTVPGMWYVFEDKRYRREKFMKHKLKDILEGFDESLTEKQNMLAHGFEVLYDSGSIKYTIENHDADRAF